MSDPKRETKLPADEYLNVLLAGLLDATLTQNALDRMSGYFNAVASRGASPWWKRANYQIMRQRRGNQDVITRYCEQIEELNRTDPITAGEVTSDNVDMVGRKGGHQGTENSDDSA